MEEEVKCPECGAPMELKYAGYGAFYGCTHYPDCRGRRQADREENPSGETVELKEARSLARREFNKLWKPESSPLDRHQAYEFLSSALQLCPSDSHIARLDVADCRLLIRSARRKLRDLCREQQGLPVVPMEEAKRVLSVAPPETLVSRLAESLLSAYEFLPKEFEFSDDSSEEEDAMISAAADELLEKGLSALKAEDPLRDAEGRPVRMARLGEVPEELKGSLAKAAMQVGCWLETGDGESDIFYLVSDG